MSLVDLALRRARQGEAPPPGGARNRVQPSIDAPAFDTFTQNTFPSEGVESETEVSQVQTATKPIATNANATAQQFSGGNHLDEPLLDKIVSGSGIMPACREQYRRLAGALHHLQADRDIKVVMVASAVVGEGKTLTATNLALTFSESYRRRVLLIDADLRSPTLHRLFQVPNSAGLREGLEAPTDQKIAALQLSSTLSLLTAGRAASDPMAGLTSQRMRRVLEDARESFDWIIIDTPPVALLPDTNLLAAMVDAAVLVVKAAETRYELVQHAVEAVGRGRIVGVVLNYADDGDFQHHYNPDMYYRRYRESELRPSP